MAHKIVKEVTSPVHGPGGVVVHAPGEQFPEDHELGPEVTWRLVIAEVADEPDEPVKATAKPAAADEPEPVKATAKSPAGKH